MIESINKIGTAICDSLNTVNRFVEYLNNAHYILIMWVCSKVINNR